MEERQSAAVDEFMRRTRENRACAILVDRAGVFRFHNLGTHIDPPGKVGRGTPA